jgi:hypothetical protein
MCDTIGPPPTEETLSIAAAPGLTSRTQETTIHTWSTHHMAYPNPTTYTLPFGDKIRVSSRRRFVLVRQNDQARFEENSKPFVVRRSDTFDVVYREFNLLSGRTDYIIDQRDRTVTYWFNGKKETQNV